MSCDDLFKFKGGHLRGKRQTVVGFHDVVELLIVEIHAADIGFVAHRYFEGDDLDVIFFFMSNYFAFYFASVLLCRCIIFYFEGSVELCIILNH